MTNANTKQQEHGTEAGQAQRQLLRNEDDLMPGEPTDRSGRARLWASLAAGVLILALGGGALFWQGKDGPGETIVAVSTQRTVILAPQPVSQQLDITGTIAAGRSVPIVAPFEGMIRKKLVQLGDPVSAGEVLVVMDTSEIANRFRDAQSAYLKSAMAADALEKWQTGPDMLRARRALDAAQATQASLERQVKELKVLLDQGIVSRNEFDGLVQQRDSQINTVASATDELASTAARGNDENRQLVVLELENARSRLNDLKQQMAGAKVATAIAGVLTRPPLNASGQEPGSVEPGANVTRGAALFSIADTSSFIVTGAVDEVDVNRVKIGQTVRITSDAFPGKTVTGRIVSVSAEVSGKDFSRGAPSFEVRCAFSVDDEALRKAIRIGMSARMSVETYSNPTALILPPTAIVDTGAGLQVRVHENGKTITVPVLIGETFPQGIEITSGLQAGSEVFE